MNDLIKIQPQAIGGQTIETVNARELHSFLEVGKVFASWIKDRIEQYNFIENLDYGVFTETGNNLSGGRPSKEYAISIDMAKELAMVERLAEGGVISLPPLVEVKTNLLSHFLKLRRSKPICYLFSSN